MSDKDTSTRRMDDSHRPIFERRMTPRRQEQSTGTDQGCSLCPC